MRERVKLFLPQYYIGPIGLTTGITMDEQSSVRHMDDSEELLEDCPT